MSETPRRMGPLDADHPSVGQPCAACSVAIVGGDYVTIVVIGPGDDPDAQERAREGRAYAAVGVIAHYACATGKQ